MTLPLSGNALSLEVLLEPIDPGQPCGPSLRYDPDYDRLRELRREDDSSLPTGVWQAEAKRADWAAVEQLASELLQRRSKDLMLAAWLGEAWLQRGGLGGLQRALVLLAELCERYPEEVHPQAQDGDQSWRVPPIDWLLRRYAELLGLERSREVARRLGLGRPAKRVVTVTGTNGKGSTCALLAELLREQGLSVGVYSSPHLLRYNERVRIDGVEAGDAQLCDAFSAVEAARGEISLTYFEMGTLAAFWLFERAGLDFAVLEVGLGGRLDAVNLIDADLALITSIGLDHADWLGDTRESVAFEKAGILRAVQAFGVSDGGQQRLRCRAGGRQR